MEHGLRDVIVVALLALGDEGCQRCQRLVERVCALSLWLNSASPMVRKVSRSKDQRPNGSARAAVGATTALALTSRLAIADEHYPGEHIGQNRVDLGYR